LNKFTYIAQSQESECGLCCVAMVLNYFGCNFHPRNIHGYEDVGRDGISLQKAGEILKSYNLNIDFYEASSNRLKDIFQNPLILYWENNHFVVLYKITKKYFYIADPALGKIKLKSEDFQKKYSGFALVSKPNKKFKTIKNDDINEWHIYIDHLKNNKLRFVLLFSISILFSLSVLLVPSFISSLTHDYEVTKNIDNNYLLSLIVIIPLFILLYLVRMNFMLSAVKNLDTDNYRKIIKKLFRVPFKFYLTRSSSTILFRLGLLRSNREMLFETIFKGILDGLVAIILLIAISINHFSSSIIMILLSLIVGVILFLLRKNIILKNKLELNEYTKMQSLEYETFSSIFSIKANSQEKYMENLLEEKNKESIQAYYNRNKTSNVYSTITYFINTFGSILVLLLSIILIPNSQINVGILIFIFTLSGLYFQNFSSIFDTFNTLGTLKNNMIKINDIIEQKSESFYNGDIKINNIETIEFNNVFFRYPGQKEYTLTNLNFKISNKEKVGFAGATGSGKSTILGLILGIYKPSQGEILINNINLKKIDLEQYKKHIGFVPQEPFVYNKSIKDNILMNRDLDYEQVEKALVTSHLVQDIINMPLGLETVISEGGTNISGGQKQRVIIARSVVHNPDMLLFDEATSSLDNHTENIISENIQMMSQTQIIVAHRLKTIQNCDKIIFLSNGKINDIGDYNYLITHNKKFKTFSN